MNTIWRKDGRQVKATPELDLEGFAIDTELKKQTVQLQGGISAAPSIQITETRSAVANVPAPQPPPPAPLDLPSEIIQVCYNGRPAEFRMYGGFIRYLD
jgi:hypothetical protein